jgi:hypothetical protein
MELGAAAGGIRGQRALLGADQGLGKAELGRSRRGGQGRGRPGAEEAGAAGGGSSRSVQGPGAEEAGAAGGGSSRKPGAEKAWGRGRCSRCSSRKPGPGPVSTILAREVAGEKTREELGDSGVGASGASGACTRGPTGGRSEAFCGMDSTKLGCEARSELPNPAWLRDLICMSWAVLR